jgi:lysophospholipase L1-like esterase
MSVKRPLLTLLAGLLGVVLLSAAARAESESEVHVRDGLPKLAARTHDSSGELRVAYLGGSITAADGWRGLTTSYLRTLYPRLDVVEISAGLPGTGSDLGACRLGRDVLEQHPDLLFVEFAVNDSSTAPAQIERTMEGIVRQTWRANPQTDICFVYTVSAHGLADLEAGRFQPSARAMETVAQHYGIPSIHFGLEVARQVVAGSLIFKGVAPEAGNVFSLDGVHPTPAGHQLYLTVIKRCLPALIAPAEKKPHRLSAPLHSDNWQYARLETADSTVRNGKWARVGSDDPNLRGVTKSLLPPTWRATEAGASIEFTFTGREFGLLGIAAPDTGEFRVTVDDQPSVTDTLFDAYASPTFCRQRPWFYPQKLADGAHHVRIELTGTKLDKAAIKSKAGKPIDDPAPYAPNALTVCGILIVGSSAP